MEQRVCIKFCFKNGIKCSAALSMLNVAFGPSSMNKTSVYTWYKRFQEGREDVEDDERHGRPSTSITDDNVERVKKMIMDNRRISMREVADNLGLSFSSCQAIISNVLGMRHVAGKFVPKLLHFEQKQCRTNVAQELLHEVNQDAELLQRVITGGETWLYGFDTNEIKTQQNAEEPPAKKARPMRPNVKALLIVFFDCNGVVYQEFMPAGCKFNKEYYLEVLRYLLEAIRTKRPELWRNRSWQLHHDNALIHTSLLVREFLAKNNILMLPQPTKSTNSPDLSPCDFFLFPKLLKRTMKGQPLASIDEVKAKALKTLYAIPKSAFQKCFEDWQKRWHKCIISDGDYVEDDKLKSDEK